MATIAAPRSCPHSDRVRKLAWGAFDDAEAAPLEAHVARCPHCATVFDAETAPVLEAIRSNSRSSPLQDEADAIDRLIAKLVRLPEVSKEKPASPSTLLREDHTPDAGAAHSGTLPATPTNRPKGAPSNSDDARFADELRRLLAPSQEPNELGRLGCYRILRVLGRGGMGAVFEAEDTQLARRVALKVILPTPGGYREDRRQRFFREAKAAAKLDHDNVVPVYEAREENGVPYIVMPLLKGESLASRLEREERLPVQLAFKILRETAEGLKAAHAAGLIHRDLKPENIWLEERDKGLRVRILDFGLACWHDGTDAMTADGVIMGTPQYMAPEQARGETVDARADLFSLGCVLYRMLTGRRPFDGQTLSAVLVQVLRDQPQTPKELNATIPPSLSALTMRLLAKQRDERPRDAKHLIELLRSLAKQPNATPPVTAESSPPTHAPTPIIQARPARMRTALRRPLARNWRIAAALSGFLALLVATVIIIRIRTPQGEVSVEIYPDPPEKPKSSQAKRNEGPEPPKPLPPNPLPKEVTNSIGMKLVYITPGSFKMGTAPGELGDHDSVATQHEVVLTRGYYIGQFEVTQQEYTDVMASNPSTYRHGARNETAVKDLDTRRLPVDNLSWDLAKQFCTRLSNREEERAEGRTYRLPTEAEWEYACRAGTDTPFSFGKSASSSQANFDGRHPYNNGPVGPCLNRPQPVGSYPFNQWKLYDMHGNVAEICEDVYGPFDIVAKKRVDPTGVTRKAIPPDGRVHKGGAFASPGTNCRSGFRSQNGPKEQAPTVGMRVVMTFSN